MHISIPGNFPRYFLYLAGSDTVRRVVREGWEVAGGQVGHGWPSRSLWSLVF